MLTLCSPFNVQAEINPSIETEERIREEYEAAARRAAEAALAAAAAMQAAEAEEAAAAEAAARRERVRLAKEAALPAEPPADSAQPLVTCLFRFPDGGRHSRRFPLGAPLQVGCGAGRVRFAVVARGLSVLWVVGLGCCQLIRGAGCLHVRPFPPSEAASLCPQIRP